MSDSSHIPAGFCPHCDYAMDPGICPECGREIGETSLVRSASRQRLKRVTKRAIKTVLVVAFLGGAVYGIYHETRAHRWVRYCTTDFLFSMDWQTRMNVSREIDRRFLAGKFTRAQTKTYLTATTTSPEIAVRSPRPMGSDSRVTGSFDPRCISNGGGLSWSPLIQEICVGEELWIDGSLQCRRNTKDSVQVELARLIPQMKPGRHTIEIRRRVKRDNAVEIWPTGLQKLYAVSRHPHLPCVVNVGTTKTIVIEAAPYERFVRGLFDDAIREDALFDNWFDALGPDWKGMQQDHEGPRIAGRLTFIASPYGPRPVEFSFHVPHDVCRIAQELPDTITGAEEVYAVFAPDAQIAFDAGYQSYFNGVIEWFAIEFIQRVPQLGTPDLVREFEASDRVEKEFAARN